MYPYLPLLLFIIVVVVVFLIRGRGRGRNNSSSSGFGGGSSFGSSGSSSKLLNHQLAQLYIATGSKQKLCQVLQASRSSAKYYKQVKSLAKHYK